MIPDAIAIVGLLYLFLAGVGRAASTPAIRLSGPVREVETN